MEHGSGHKSQNHYGRLAIELTLDFIVMYTMIAALAHCRLHGRFGPAGADTGCSHPAW